MKYLPIKIDGLDVAFGGKAMEILPKYSDIPEEFKRGKHPARKFASDWFYGGLDSIPQSVDGIDRAMALANLRACLVDFEPKHEHKMDGVAYLASLWLKI